MFTKVVIAALLLCVALVSAAGKNWAVLVSGSNGYWNYRHQSDVYHAFQLLKKNGIKSENIIVMQYDDIANNPSNPKKGTVINIPGGPNVYTPDIPKDYIGKDVTAKNFLKVLRGEKMDVGSGKTLATGPEDNVFIFWTDHGAPGVLAFPTGDFLHAKDFIATLKFMFENKKYKELVFYLEACESGSMFNNLLPANWNIYATTAANPFESSYACFYDGTYRAYLNDCYSYYWMNNTETSDIHSKTLKVQFEEVKKQTTLSHVCQYGDFSMNSQVLANFQAAKKAARAQDAMYVPGPALKKGDYVDSRNAKQAYLEKQVAASRNSVEKLQWQKELAHHMQQQRRSDVVWGAFAYQMKLRSAVEDHKKFSTNADDHCYSKLALDVDCMKGAAEAAIAKCGIFDETSFKYLDMLRDACHTGYSVEEIEKKLDEICSLVPSV